MVESKDEQVQTYTVSKGVIMLLDKLFRFLTRQIQNTEHALITFIAAVIPWLVPLVPAYLTGIHIVEDLDLPWWTGWVIGAIIEGLGLASMSKIVAFWENNRRYTAEVNKMPIWIPGITYIWYLLIVIVVNVFLEKDAGASSIRIWTIGLLATLSVPTAALIAVNSIWTERMLQKDLDKHAKASARTPKSSESFRKVSPKVQEELPKDWRKLRPQLNHEELRTFAFLSASNVTELAKQYNVTERTVWNWVANAKRELGENKNEQ